MRSRSILLLVVALLGLFAGAAVAKRVEAGRYLGKGIRLNVHVPGARNGIEVVQTAANRKIIRGRCTGSNGSRAYSTVPDRQLGLGFFRGKAPRIGRVATYHYSLTVSEENVRDTYSGTLKVHMLTARKGRVAIRLVDVTVLEGRPVKKNRCSGSARFTVKR